MSSVPSVVKVFDSLPAHNLPRQSPRNRDRMCHQNRDLPQQALRLMKHPELSQHGSPVVIDFFPRQAVIAIEGINTAERNLDPPSGGRKAAPRSQMRPANQDLHENRVIRYMSPLHINHKIRQSRYELLVKRPDAVPSLIVFSPRLVVVARLIAESCEHAFQIMLVLQPNMTVHNRDTSSQPVSRNWSASHTYLSSLYKIGPLFRHKYYHSPLAKIAGIGHFRTE